MPQKGQKRSLDLTSLASVTPKTAPVGEPLSGRERAGVNLTWGVLGLTGLFLTVVVLVLWTNERNSAATLTQILGSGDTLATVVDTVKTRIVSEERTAFRAFWLGLTQTVLLNVLLPVLTALLGYVFGTTQARARAEGSDR